MKKNVFGLLALMLTFLFSCTNKIDTGNGRDGMVDFTIKTSVPKGIKTYASDNGGATNVDAGTYSLRYIMEVYDMSDQFVYRTQRIGDDFTTPVTFNVRLLAKQYKFVFWADFVEASSPTADLYYNTGDAVNGGLTDITINTAKPYDITNDTRDAFFGVVSPVDLTQISQMGDVILNRPFGKYRLIATDKPDGPTINLNTASAEINYGTNMEFPSEFNALTGEVGAATIPVGDIYTGKITQEDNPVVGGQAYPGPVYVLAFDYIFAPQDVASSFPVEFSATVKDGGVALGSKAISPIPIVRNKLTTVIGNFFTNTANWTVSVDDMFNGETGPFTNQVAMSDLNALLKFIYDNGPAAPIDLEVTNDAVPGASYTVDIPAYSTTGTPSVTLHFVGNVTSNLTFESNAALGGDYTGEINLYFSGLTGTVTNNIATPAMITSNATAASLMSNNLSASSTGGFYIGAKNLDDLLAITIAQTNTINKGVVLLSNITGIFPASGIGGNTGNPIVIGARATPSLMAGYVIDGRGFSITGTATQNLIMIYANDVKVKNLTVTNTGAGARNGISLISCTGVELDHLTLLNNGGGGVIVNGATAKATNITSSGNGWGYAFNVAKGSGVTTTPHLTMGGTNNFLDAKAVFAEGNKSTLAAGEDPLKDYVDNNMPDYSAASWVDGTNWGITNITFTPAVVAGDQVWSGTFNYDFAESSNSSDFININDIAWRSGRTSPATWNVGAKYLTFTTRTLASTGWPAGFDTYYYWSGLNYCPQGAPILPDASVLSNSWSVTTSLFIDGSASLKRVMLYVVDGGASLTDPYASALDWIIIRYDGSAQLWDDSDGNTFGGAYTSVGEHQVKIEYTGAEYNFYIDGAKLYTEPKSSAYGACYPAMIEFNARMVDANSIDSKWAFPVVQ